MTSTCPTCGCRTDTPALAFLPERVHEWKSPPFLYEFPDGLSARVAALMEAYAKQAVEERNREVAEVLRETAQSMAVASRFTAAYEIAHRLGLNIEPPPTE
jgi:hypothetical protein